MIFNIILDTGSHHDQQGFVFYFVLVSLILLSSAFGHRFLPFFCFQKNVFYRTFLTYLLLRFHGHFCLKNCI